MVPVFVCSNFLPTVGNHNCCTNNTFTAKAFLGWLAEWLAAAAAFGTVQG